jgi:DNA-directed RNA polymerase subunit omega
MARVTVEDCLEHVDNRFALVLLGAQRARQLLKGAKPTVEHSKNKAAVLSLREIAGGNVYFDGDLIDVLNKNYQTTN